MNGPRAPAILRRALRLAGQSRIRLPQRALALSDIQVGDRLQVGGVVWRARALQAGSGTAPALVLERCEPTLATAAVAGSALLCGPESGNDSGGRGWTLREETATGTIELALTASAILHIPVVRRSDDG